MHQLEGALEGGGDFNRGIERSPESHESTGVNLESISSPQDSIDKGKKTKLAGKKVQEEKTLHKSGKVFSADKKKESIIPIRGKDSLEATTPQKVPGEEMQ